MWTAQHAVQGGVGKRIVTINRNFQLFMLNIGILQPAGIAGNIIEHALNNPEQQEVFVPVIYSKENGNDKNVSSDLKFGNIKAVVVAPGSAKEFSFPDSMTVYADGNVRVASVFETEGVSADAEKDVLAERISKAWQSLRRDFLCSSPRIALMSMGQEQDEQLLRPLVQEMAAQGVGVFGPYNIESHIEEQQYQHFDLTLCIDNQQLSRMLTAVSLPSRVKILTGIPMVMASTDYSAAFDFDSVSIDEPAYALRQAVYAVIDVCRCREAYDEAHANPLPKIYHERKDDSEKVRFAVKK